MNCNCAAHNSTELDIDPLRDFSPMNEGVCPYLAFCCQSWLQKQNILLSRHSWGFFSHCRVKSILWMGIFSLLRNVLLFSREYLCCSCFSLHFSALRETLVKDEVCFNERTAGKLIYRITQNSNSIIDECSFLLLYRFSISHNWGCFYGLCTETFRLDVSLTSLNAKQ